MRQTFVRVFVLNNLCTMACKSCKYMNIYRDTLCTCECLGFFLFFFHYSFKFGGNFSHYFSIRRIWYRLWNKEFFSIIFHTIQFEKKKICCLNAMQLFWSYCSLCTFLTLCVFGNCWLVKNSGQHMFYDLWLSFWIHRSRFQQIINQLVQNSFEYRHIFFYEWKKKTYT